MTAHTFAGEVAIVGIGATEFSKASGRSELRLATEAVKAAIAEHEAALGERGRILIRASGTEPVIRVMAEADDETTVLTVVEALAGEIRARATPAP